jgi:hypothetical protein
MLIESEIDEIATKFLGYKPVIHLDYLIAEAMCSIHELYEEADLSRCASFTILPHAIQSKMRLSNLDWSIVMDNLRLRGFVKYSEHLCRDVLIIPETKIDSKL